MFELADFSMESNFDVGIGTHVFQKVGPRSNRSEGILKQENE